MERIYIGMGSNLADPAEQLRNAVQALAQLPDSRFVGVSAFYQSDSLLPGQPRYTNAVAAIDSAMHLWICWMRYKPSRSIKAANVTNAGGRAHWTWISCCSATA